MSETIPLRLDYIAALGSSELPAVILASVIASACGHSQAWVPMTERTLMDVTHLGRTQVRRGLAVLLDAGIIERRTSPGRGRASYAYRIADHTTAAA